MNASPAAWERLGSLLAKRRVEIDLTYRSRLKFAAATGLNERLISDLERARRTGYRDETIHAIELAYQLAPGSVETALRGGDLTPAPAEEGKPADDDWLRPPEGLELPPGFDPTSLPPDIVDIYYLKRIPSLKIREILVQSYKLLKDADVGGSAQASPGDDTVNGSRAAAN